MSAPTIAVTVLLFAASTLRAQCTSRWLAHPRDFPAVDVALPWDQDGTGPIAPRLAIGGAFQTVDGQVSIHAATYDATTNTFGELYGLGWGAGSGITRLCALRNGDLVAGGTFSLTLTYPTDHIARRDATGWHALGAGLVAAPRAIAALGATGVAAVLDNSNSVLAFDGVSWGQLGGAGNGNVRTLAALANGTLVAGGAFTQLGTIACSRVASWNGSQWQPMGAGRPGEVLQLAAIPGGEVAALCLAVGGSAVARWDGVAWTQLGGVFPTQPAGMFVDAGGVVHVFGNSGAGAYVRRWIGTAWADLPAVPTAVRTIAPVPDGTLVAFATDVDNPVRVYDGIAWHLRTAGLDGGVRTVATTADGRLCVGGGFTGRIRAASGASFASLAAWPFQALNGAVLAVGADAAAGPGALVVGGVFTGFTNTSSVPLRGIARFDGSAWQEVGGGVDAPVHALARMPNGDLVVGGALLHAGAVPAFRIARWDGVAWHALGQGASGDVHALAVASNGDLFAGGAFAAAGGIGANRVARWDGSMWHALGAGANGIVRALVLAANGDLVAGGDFTAVGGQPASHVARWDGSQWHALGGGVDGAVRTLFVMADGRLVAGGDFQTAGGAGAQRIAVWDGNGWQSLAGGGADAAVHTIGTWSDGRLVVGGDFTRFAGLPSRGVATLTSPCLPTAASTPGGCAAGAITLRADSLPFAGATFRSSATGFAGGALGVALAGLSSPGTSLGTVFPTATPGCTLRASPDSILLVLPQNGTASWQFAIPGGTAFVGLTVFHQFLQLSIGQGGGLASVEASNGLALVLGVL